jgi:hypothetical protein
MQDGSGVETTYPFTAPELARLAAYRAAVRAGLYTDYPADGPNERRDVWAGSSDAAAAPAADPSELLTPEELERLGSFKDAIEAGLLFE